MSEKNESPPKIPEDDGRPGFKINLPFGFGWLRGDGSHLSLLMPAFRWVLVLASLWFIIERILRDLK